MRIPYSNKKQILTTYENQYHQRAKPQSSWQT